jgi:hypothetical protein
MLERLRAGATGVVRGRPSKYSTMTIAGNTGIQVVIQKVVSNQPEMFECSETMIESYDLYLREALELYTSLLAPMDR